MPVVFSYRLQHYNIEWVAFDYFGKKPLIAIFFFKVMAYLHLFSPSTSRVSGHCFLASAYDSGCRPVRDKSASKFG